MEAWFWCVIPFLAAVQCTIVEIPNGKLQGSYNGEYYSFTNIPFAQPPVGSKRFEAPIAYTTKWTGIRSATEPSPSCVETEDCLVVNVFTPNIKPKERYTVRVYLYGGGFMIGAAGDTAEQYIPSQNIVFVIPNYRVGAFGFLSSGTDLVSGNFGLKDQQLALKWVHENIHAFGGDPTKVLLTGASAGGASVHLHLLNPGSWQYFNAAVSSSGSAFNPWVMQPNPKEQFRKYIGHLGCDLSNPEQIKQCLLDRTLKEHSTATNAMLQFRDNPFNVFGVVVESKQVQDAFLTDHPRTLIKRGQISTAPWVACHSHREGSFTAAEFLSYDENGKVLIDILNSRWREIAPIVLFYKNSCVDCSETEAVEFRDTYSDLLRHSYMKGKNFSVETYPLLEQMFTDVLFVNGIKEGLHLHRVYSSAPGYACDYRNALPLGIGNILSNCSKCNFGADHGADTQCVAPLKFLQQNDSCPPTTKCIADNLIEMGRGLSTLGVAKYFGKELPVNTPTTTGSLIIYDTYHVLETYTYDGGRTKTIYNNFPC